MASAAVGVRATDTAEPFVLLIRRRLRTPAGDRGRPVDVIKADRSFLDGLGSDRRELAVLQAILAIGDGLGIQVVAEGIATQRQRELLRLSGCPFGQGFLFARPLAAEEIVVGPRPQPPIALRGLPGREARGTTLAASPTV